MTTAVICLLLKLLHYSSPGKPTHTTENFAQVATRVNQVPKPRGLKDIMLTEISQAREDKYCMTLYVESKNIEYIEAGSGTMVTWARGWRRWGDVGQRVQSCSDAG